MQGVAISLLARFLRGISKALPVTLAIAAPGLALPVAAQDGSPPAVKLTPAQMFDVASQAEAKEDYATAEALLEALASHPDLELRSEARFRLALLRANRQGRIRDGAVLLRQILDEQPEAARVRVELARLLVMLNDREGAERELRAARAAGLPPEIERLVHFYAQALSSPANIGLNLEATLAPDSNINRATASDTLSTVIGDLELSDDARRKSGLGLAMRAQGYGRVPLGGSAELAATISAAIREYDGSAFDDYQVSAELGPQWQSGGDRISLAANIRYRWFGDEPFTEAHGGRAEIRHPVGKRGRLRASVSALDEDNRRNDQQDQTRLSLDVGIDRAFTSRWGAGFYLTGSRAMARAEPYSNASGGLRAYVFREFGQTSLALSGSYSHLEADQVLGLYGARRIDDFAAVGLSGTFRSFRVGTFAPIARLQFERNASSIEIYDFTRKSVEIGLTAAF
ncbi:surface lipoprotein assembly modifier [Croceicoccus mobilis]|uniref:Surface lipoprotein assembly modifier C-terminal domain-containing protein n=1 Tax=Croceicoccus mobilis TaxID=1703339 RepID=A0A916YVW4_9SPHN|nr:tetratricopeptide repeat protein [Croceicoccus mobilis]GGD63888.1 hypothetical protein GCM10010990_11700 [Croceicoccus mobilis]